MSSSCRTHGANRTKGGDRTGIATSTGASSGRSSGSTDMATPRHFRWSSFLEPRPNISTSTPQLLFKTPQLPFNRDHKALNRGTLGGLGSLVQNEVSMRLPGGSELEATAKDGPFSPGPGGQGSVSCFQNVRASRAMLGWVAVKELTLSYKNLDIW